MMDSVKRKLNEIKEIHDINCILQIGTIGGCDVDLLVFIEDGNEFLREVKKIDGVEFDISYIPIPLLKKGIKEKWPFLIMALQDFHILYLKNECIKEELKHIDLIKPNALTQEEINFYRFTLTKEYQSIIGRSHEKEISRFLMYVLLKKAIEFYYKVNQLFVPKEKKLFAILKKHNGFLYDQCMNFLDEPQIGDLKTILDNVLTPYGGLLTYWDKDKYPLI